MSATLLIERLGAQGDGVAETARGQVFVPYALPGEEVIALAERGRGALISIEKPSPLRVEPACRHFGTCGGCAIQHLEADAYRAWKRDIVVQALKSRGIEAEVDDTRPLRAARAAKSDLHRTAHRSGMLLGFNRRCRTKSCRSRNARSSSRGSWPPSTG